MTARLRRFLLFLLCTLSVPQGVRAETPPPVVPPPPLRLCGSAFSLNPQDSFPRVLRVGTRPLGTVVSERTGHAFIPSAEPSGIGATKVRTCRSSVTTIDATSGRFIRSVAVDTSNAQAAVDDKDGRVFVVGLDEAANPTPFKLALTILSLEGKVLAPPQAFSPCPCVWGGMAGALIRADGKTHRVFVLTLESVVTFDAFTGRRLATVPLDVNGSGGFSGFEVDESRDRVFIATSTGVAVIDARTGTLAQTVDLGRTERKIVLDRRTGRVFVGNAGGCRGTPQGPGSVVTLDAATGKKIAAVLSYCGAYFPLLDDGPAGRVFVGVPGGAMQSQSGYAVLDARTGKVMRMVKSTTDITAVNERTGHVYGGFDGRSVGVYDPYTWRLVGKIRVGMQTGTSPGYSLLTFNAHLKRLYAVNPYAGTITIALLVG